MIFFSLFHIAIEGKGGRTIGGGGGAKGMLPPSQIIGGGLAPLAPLFLRLCNNNSIIIDITINTIHTCINAVDI